jgi:hypothetical protein
MLMHDMARDDDIVIHSEPFQGRRTANPPDKTLPPYPSIRIE